VKPVMVREVALAYKRGRKLKFPIDARLSDSAAAAALLRQACPWGPKEVFVVVGLDTKNRPLAYCVIGIGGPTWCAIAPADVMRFLLLSNSVSFLCGHNHPSGDPGPSADDIELTKRLADAATLFGIGMLDHIIIGETEHYSLLDHGEMR